MKKIKYLILIMIMISIPTKIKAYSAKQSATYMNDFIKEAIMYNDWTVTNSSKNKDNYTIEIEIGDTTKNQLLKDTISGIPKTFANKKLYKSYATLFGCKSADKCDENNFDYTIKFQAYKKSDSKIYLKSDLVSKSDYNGFKSSKKVMYNIATNQKGIGSNITKEGSYTPVGDNYEEKYDKTVGRIGNPKKIGKNTTVTVPAKEDKFWDDAGVNKCYYIEFNFDGGSYARYKISDREIALKNIFWGNDPAYVLASNLVEDSGTTEQGIFGVSNADKNYYAICGVYGKKITFKFIDNNEIKTANELQQQEAERQNGDGSSDVLTEKEIKELAEARAAIAGSWDPDKLCADDNCNIDITAFCINPYVSRTLKFLGILLAIAKIIVPAIIIILGFVDLAKIVISGKVDEAKKQATNIVKRVVIGMVIFLIPTILITIYNVAYNIANDKDELTDGTLNVPENFKNCVGCILDATNSESCVVNTEAGNETIVSSGQGSVESQNYYQGAGNVTSGNSSGTITGTGSASGSSTFTNYTGKSSEKVSKRTTTNIKLDKDMLVLSVSHVNYAKLNANVKNLTWKSSNTNVATVNKNGEVRAKEKGSATITVTSKDGATAKVKVKVITRAKYLGNRQWVIEQTDYTKEEKETYINLAEELCHSDFYKQHTDKYTYCPSASLLYYEGSSPYTLTPKHMYKKLGLSATNYLVFVSSAKQTITLMQKNSNGVWKALKKGRVSTGKDNLNNSYRHDYWIGAIYGNGFTLFSSHPINQKNPEGTMHAPEVTGRAIHIGGQLGYPHSGGCVRISKDYYTYLYSYLKGKYGTLVINL